MTLRKDVEKRVKANEFNQRIELLLTPDDKEYLIYALKEYRTYKSVAKLMLALNSCLDTPEKLDLLPFIRDLIPKHDQKRFDSLAPYNRMAHPSGSPHMQNRDYAAAQQPSGIRTVSIRRAPDTSLGFSIRGGMEHNLGIYISHVDSFSVAEKSGLVMGDQILNVNSISFTNISHVSAVLVLTSHDDLRITVRSVGRIPGQRVGRNAFVWY